MKNKNTTGKTSSWCQCFNVDKKIENKKLKTYEIKNIKNMSRKTSSWCQCFNVVTAGTTHLEKDTCHMFMSTMLEEKRKKIKAQEGAIATLDKYTCQKYAC